MSIRRRIYRNKDGTVSVYYLGSVRLSNGKELSKQFERKTDAQNWKADQTSQRNAGALSQSKQTMSFRELADYWLTNYAEKRKEGSSKIRDEIILKQQIFPFFGGKRLMDLNSADVEIWQQKMMLDQSLAPKTVNNCLGLFKKILNDAVRWRFLRYNPIGIVAPLPVDEQDFNFWTLDECQKFLVHAREKNQLAYFAVGIALYTGMRKGEIKGLKWDCVDFNLKQITVKRSFCLKEQRLKEKTKSKKIRRVPINQALHAMLLELKARYKSEWVLPDFDYDHAWRTVKRLAVEAEVRPIRFHDTRHTFASNFLMSGGSIYTLQRILGHSTLAMTERYSHMSPEHLQGATEMLDFGTGKLASVVAIQKETPGSDFQITDKMRTKKIANEKFVSDIKRLKNRGGGI
jgi:integrase